MILYTNQKKIKKQKIKKLYKEIIFLFIPHKFTIEYMTENSYISLQFI